MSDTPPENSAGLWLAVDGKYYAPDLHPDYVAPMSWVAPNRPQDSDTQSLYSAPNIATSVAPVPLDAWTTRVRILVFGGAAGLVLGSLLPWVQIVGIMSLSVAGTEGDGVFTLIAGIVVALLFAVARPRMAVAITGLLVGAVATLFAIYELANVSGRISDPEVGGNEMFTAQIGSGLWIVGIAAVALLAGGIDAVVGGRKDSDQ